MDAWGADTCPVCLWFSPYLYPCWPLRKAAFSLIFPLVCVLPSSKGLEHIQLSHLSLAFSLLFYFGEGSGQRRRGREKRKIQKRWHRPTSSDINHGFTACYGPLVPNCGNAEITGRDTYSGTSQSETAISTMTLTLCLCTWTSCDHTRLQEVFWGHVQKQWSWTLFWQVYWDINHMPYSAPISSTTQQLLVPAELCSHHQHNQFQEFPLTLYPLAVTTSYPPKAPVIGNHSSTFCLHRQIKPFFISPKRLYKCWTGSLASTTLTNKFPVLSYLHCARQ